jgi:hypothetical protein
LDIANSQLVVSFHVVDQLHLFVIQPLTRARPRMSANLAPPGLGTRHRTRPRHRGHESRRDVVAPNGDSSNSICPENTPPSSPAAVSAPAGALAFNRSAPPRQRTT